MERPRNLLPVIAALSLVFCKGQPVETPEDPSAVSNVACLTSGISGTVKNAVEHEPKGLPLKEEPLHLDMQLDFGPADSAEISEQPLPITPIASPKAEIPATPDPVRQKPAPAPITPQAPVQNPAQIPESHETSNAPIYLNRILGVYKYVIGPGHKSRGFYRVDITNNFKPYGPNPKVCPAETVPAFYGSIRHATFEQKFHNSQLNYKDGKLLEKTAAAFDRAFAKSKLKSLLQAAGADQYFRDLVIYGLVSQESGWNPNIRSRAGAVGLFQAMPATVRTLVRTGKLPAGINPLIPEDAATFAVALFENHLEYLVKGDKDIQGIGPNSFLFKGENVKNILVPLLVTSFNAGKGRLNKLAQYIIEMHREGSMPNEFYTDKKAAIFNDNAFLHLLSRAYTQIRSNKKTRQTHADLKFGNNNSGFGKDGAQYALKIMATAELFMQNLHIQRAEAEHSAPTIPAKPPVAKLPTANPPEQIPPNCRPDNIDRNGDPYRILKTTRQYPTLVEILEANGVDVPGWQPSDGDDGMKRLWATPAYEDFIGPIKTYGKGSPKANIKLGEPFPVPGRYFQNCRNLQPRKR